jgi:hypothetical protein
MSLATSLSLQSPNGQIWKLGVTTSGLLQTSLVGSGTAVSPIFRDSDGSGTFWRLGVDNNGLLTTTQVMASLATSQNFWRLYDAAGIDWLVCINSQGDLLSAHGCMPPFAGSVQIGELVPSVVGSYPPAEQPGGIGTVVTDPTQQPDEMTGLWFFGCGHSFVHMDIRIQAQNGCPVALVRCPVCGYVQRIISPASELHSEANQVVLA